jgi:hypothetical protein
MQLSAMSVSHRTTRSTTAGFAGATSYVSSWRYYAWRFI